MLPARRTTESLCELGYRVLEAASGTAALEALRNDSDIDLLFTDVVILKNTFANNAFENFEIAAYKSLLALCEPALQSRHFLSCLCRPRLFRRFRKRSHRSSWIETSLSIFVVVIFAIYLTGALLIAETKGDFR
jgi:hypothetical protein